MRKFYEMSDLERQVVSLKSCPAVKHCLNGIVLHDMQSVDVATMLARGRSLVIYDTGLGKTYLASAVMKLLFENDGKNRFIFIAKKDQLIQTPKKIMDATGLFVHAFSSTQEDMARLASMDPVMTQIVMVTHQCLLREDFSEWLFKNRQFYTTLIIDEAHELSNVCDARSAILLQSMTKSFEYCYALTATPITTNLQQLVRLAAIVDGKYFGDTKAVMRELKHNDAFIEDYPSFFIKRTRQDMGSEKNYHGDIVWVEPHKTQNVERYDPMIFKGPGAENQRKALIDALQRMQGKRGLVFINMHRIREFVIEALDKTSVRYACINGNTKPDERAEIMKKFNEEKCIDVVITSVTTAVDLDCDYVMFYEFTTNVKQMIGRAHRGLGNKELDIIYFITDDSPEVDYFMDNIWARCELTARVLSQDNAGLEDVKNKIVSG